MSTTGISAIAVFDSPKCKGTVTIHETIKDDFLCFDVKLSNLKPGLHGFHIHESGNLSEGCTSCCAHFNPLKQNHGGLDINSSGKKNRHLGDLGNIEVKKDGKCEEQFYVRFIKLRGAKYNIIGRSLVVHDKPDDLGLGGDAESLKTGNAGARIGCAVIGYKDAYYF